MTRSLYLDVDQGLASERCWNLPRNAEVMLQARALMAVLEEGGDHSQAGTLYGVLLATTPAGERVVLKAVSGSSREQLIGIGWVPALTRRACMTLAEVIVLTKLAQLKQALIGVPT